jgi:hypothetical protein
LSDGAEDEEEGLDKHYHPNHKDNNDDDDGDNDSKFNRRYLS